MHIINYSQEFFFRPCALLFDIARPISSVRPCMLVLFSQLASGITNSVNVIVETESNKSNWGVIIGCLIYVLQ